MLVPHQERLLQKTHHRWKAHCWGSVEDLAVRVNSKYPQGANKNMQISFKCTNFERGKYRAVPPREFQPVCYFCCSPSSATHEGNNCCLRKDWKSYCHICPTWSTLCITLTDKTIYIIVHWSHLNDYFYSYFFHLCSPGVKGKTHIYFLEYGSWKD